MSSLYRDLQCLPIPIILFQSWILPFHRLLPMHISRVALRFSFLCSFQSFFDRFAFASPISSINSDSSVSSNPFDAFVFSQKYNFRLISYSFYLIQFRLCLSFCFVFFVEGDGKTVYFVLHLRQQMKQRTVQFIPTVSGGYPYNSSAVRWRLSLAKPPIGIFNPNSSYTTWCTMSNLSLSTVCQDQIGQISFSSMTLLYRLLDFYHGCVIIGSFHSFDVVFPIVFLWRFAHYKYDAGSNGITSGYVWIIKQFDSLG